MGQTCSMYEENEKCVQGCGGKRQLGGSKRRWEDNIEMDLQQVEREQGLD